MRVFIIGSIFCICLTKVLGQSKTGRLEISHLTGDFYIYTTYGIYKRVPVPANSMYMITSKGVVLFDTPWDSTTFQPLLDSIQIRHHKEVILCIATHFHEDRTAGLEFYRKKGIRTYTTVKTDSLSAKHDEKRAEFLIYKDTVFAIGQHLFRTYYGGWGHTPDNIVIWFDKEKILYGGCAVKSVEAEDLGNLSDANVKEWEATIRKIMDQFKNPNYIIPGHNDWKSREALTHTLKLIQDYEEKNKL
jgi:metallo-beta-lactamase class B